MRKTRDLTEFFAAWALAMTEAQSALRRYRAEMLRARGRASWLCRHGFHRWLRQMFMLCYSDSILRSEEDRVDVCLRCGRGRNAR